LLMLLLPSTSVHNKKGENKKMRTNLEITEHLLEDKLVNCGLYDWKPFCCLLFVCCVVFASPFFVVANIIWKMKA
jgi:hypothetical protein